MANIDSTTLNANKFMQCFGNEAGARGKLALAANPTAADVLRIMLIPAGTTVHALMIANSQIDTNGAPTWLNSYGYAPVNVNDGPAANATYFAAAGQTDLRTANAGKLYMNFDQITFDKDVYLTATVGTAAATFAAGNIQALVIGEARGVK